MAIPVVDFHGFLHGNEKEKEKVAHDVFEAFEKVGFVYLKNYPEITEKVKDIFELSKKFFLQSESDKMKVSRGKDLNDIMGYIPLGSEGKTFALSEDDPSSAGKPDIKESYQIYNENMVPPFKNRWPDIPKFQEKMEDFFEVCQVANLNVMSCIALGLGLEPHYFGKTADKIANTIRLLHYPPTPNERNVKRVGAHSDYGSITLLFQDDCGGLQVNVAGEFVDAVPIPDTIIVNVDMLQRWSNNRLRSTLHRVIAPSSMSGVEHLPARFSVVYFCTPNLDLSIECLPGCEGETGPKYPPINSGEYLLGRLQQQWQDKYS